ncbi:unnamed protein product [Prorocentrum cordatum]|uniref:Fe2OG dioxygenase domain-containing protein n=1 Tax=Prorocentrum cordatum TaxID=2364126 RepID=A0ABN9WVZ2_9DINO|nr:unnamed protein product [Polarella glacialis]
MARRRIFLTAMGDIFKWRSTLSLWLLQVSQMSWPGSTPGHSVIPDNTPGAGFARALAAAHAEYVAIAPAADGKASVCFYCFQDDHLELDQRHIERALEGLGVPCTRAFLGAHVELRGGVDGALVIDGTEISVVYFHCTYRPEHFATEVDWENRRLIELSRAVKAPSLLAHLAGSKRVQQVLADRAVLSRFLPQDEVAQCLAVFARQVDPSCAGSAQAVADALAKPHGWVLKPQREGGGNNLYGSELAAALRASEGLEQYVLMEKICTAPAPAWLLQNGVAHKTDTVAELGIFASYLARGNQLEKDSERLCDSQQVLMNNVSGAMLRSKHASSEEGGVCAGFGVLDTPFLLASGSTLVTGCMEMKESDAESFVMGPPYRWLPIECSCQFLENLYVRSVDAYFRMPAPGASDAEFWASNDTRSQFDDETKAAIVASVRTELGRRSAIPKLFCRNLAIALMGMASSHIFQPEFLSMWQSVLNGGPPPEAIQDVRDGAFVFPLFSREFCKHLLEELKHFKTTGLPHQQPNSMNRQGCILNEIGLGPFMDQLLSHFLTPVFRVLFPDLMAAGIDSHHSFIVRYKMGQDTSLGVHDDNSEITLNVALCDPEQYSGGKLALYHRERCEHPQLLKLDSPYIHCAGTGTALAHSGDLLHEVLPLTGGERAGLIMWLRSDTHRRSHGCPLCGKTDRLLFA